MTTRTHSIIPLAILEATPLTTPKEHNEPFDIRGLLGLIMSNFAAMKLRHFLAKWFLAYYIIFGTFEFYGLLYIAVVGHGARV